MNLEDKLLTFKLGNWSEKISLAGELIKDKEIEKELVLGLTSDYEDIRYWCLKILGEKSPKKYSGYAESMCDDECWFVRCQAALVLYDADKDRFRKKINNMMEQEKDSEAIDFLNKNLVY